MDKLISLILIAVLCLNLKEDNLILSPLLVSWWCLFLYFSHIFNFYMILNLNRFFKSISMHAILLSTFRIDVLLFQSIGSPIDYFVDFE
jgi:hypothetical protein